jgi:phage repressor protein C with HTH and peptisase S24 domain
MPQLQTRCTENPKSLATFDGPPRDLMISRDLHIACSLEQINPCSNIPCKRFTVLPMDETARRLLEIGLESGAKDFTEIAKRLGGSDQSATNWKSRGVPKAKIIEASKIFGANPAYIEEGALPKFVARAAQDIPAVVRRSPSERVQLDEHPELVQVSRVKFKLSAGVSGYAIEHEQGNGKPVFFRQDWFATNGYKPEKLFAVRVSGASMEPSLWDGDLVVINTADTAPHDGEAFAINYEGELVIKRLRRDAGEWWATSDNADQRRFAPKRCTEDVVIIGRVIYKQSERI